MEILAKIPHSVRPLLRIDNGSVLPKFVTDEYSNDIYDMTIRETDITIVTWPKSGTTWTQYIVTQIAHGTEFVKENVFYKEHIFLEHPQNYEDENSDGCYKMAEDAPSPRYLKSHMLLRYLPRETLEKKSKVIYVARNPKDAAISYYNFCLMNKLLPTYTWDEFFEGLCEGLLPYGDWFEHVLPFWKLKDEPNVIFVKYEDMKKDLRNAVIQLAAFLNKPLSEEEVAEICQSSSFEIMKKTPTASLDIMAANLSWKKQEGKHLNFMRKGVVGDWKNWFTVAQSERFDEIYKRKMAGTDLEFSFE